MTAQEVDGLFCDEYPRIVRRNGRTVLYLGPNVILPLPPSHAPLALAWFKDHLTPEQHEAYAIAHFRELRNPTASDYAHLLDTLSERPP